MNVVVASYRQQGRAWSVQVELAGRRSTVVADSLQQARWKVDALIAELSGGGARVRAVHLLNGSAAAFTDAYLRARFDPGWPEEPRASSAM